MQTFAASVFEKYMMKQIIAITGMSSVSALGNSQDEVWANYKQAQHCLSELDLKDQTVLGVTVTASIKEEIRILRNSDIKYKFLDDTVLFAMYSARKAIDQAGWRVGDDFGINIGSSRGATALFEEYYEEFLVKKKSSTLSSPTTTLGNISSWLAHDLQSKGPNISHSITCSTALHSLLNGVAWLQSGMANKFMIGGSEAPLTAFTIAQMQALKVYAKNEEAYPCQALNLDKTENTMVLGEGAGVACLEIGDNTNALAYIVGVGYATEVLTHSVSVTKEAECFQESMKMALGDLSPDDLDVVVMHAPGTVKGDLSEYNAIKKVFGEKLPALTTNKWKIGHTFGASGILSLELAVLMLQRQEFIDVPYLQSKEPNKIKHILVNAVGFGGNAVSVLLTKA